MLWLHSSQELWKSSTACKMLFLFTLLKIIYFFCSALQILSSYMLISIRVFNRKWKQGCLLLFSRSIILPLPPYMQVSKDSRAGSKFAVGRIASLCPVMNQDLKLLFVGMMLSACPFTNSRERGAMQTPSRLLKLCCCWQTPMSHARQTFGSNFVLHLKDQFHISLICMSVINASTKHKVTQHQNETDGYLQQQSAFTVSGLVCVRTWTSLMMF